MMLRGKLLLAQLPLAMGLLLVGVLAVRTTREQGRNGRAILQDNLQSVVAVQRMAGALGEIDEAVAVAVMEGKPAPPQRVREAIQQFEAELTRQENNVTEAGEHEATARLQSAWTRVRADLEALRTEPDANLRRALARRLLAGSSIEVRAAVDEVFALNQQAMQRKSRLAQHAAARFDTLLALATLLALLAGGLASTALTARLLRPLATLSTAARRIGEGDLDARARILGSDEVAQLALEFDEMADHLRKYRETTLGELLQAQGATQAAIDSLPDAVIAFDAQGGVLAANETAEHDLHVLAGAEPLARMAPELREIVERLRAQVMEGRGPHQPHGFEEAVRVRVGGAERYLLPRASPVRGERGRIAGATVVLQDVTRLRRFDELKNDMVATVAHELRTPLTSLRMAVQLCLEGAAGSFTAKQGDLLQAAREDCTRLQTFVDDLLDLSRLQAGKIELHRDDKPVRELLDRAVQASQPQAIETGVRLVYEDLTAGATVSLDPDRTGLVFANLLANAIRHSPPEHTVSLCARIAAGAARFEVHDDGPGIPEEYRGRIFEKFFRVPGTLGGGAGLGLYICKEIVTSHGGEIGVDSAAASGSTFWFTVPLQPSGS